VSTPGSYVSEHLIGFRGFPRVGHEAASTSPRTARTTAAPAADIAPPSATATYRIHDAWPVAIIDPTLERLPTPRNNLVASARKGATVDGAAAMSFHLANLSRSQLGRVPGTRGDAAAASKPDGPDR